VPSVPRTCSLRQVLAVVLAAGYAGLISATTPFTLPADVLVAVPIGAIALLVVLQLAHRTDPTQGGSRAPLPCEWAPWAVALAVVAAWELASYFATPRSAHPTLSSMYDTLARWQAAKALVCLVWLALGWYLVRLPLERKGHQ
jgi:hypothetical protein